MADRLQVVDGDGHLVTDIAAVASRMPQEFLNRASGSSLGNIFPPIDHLHAAQPVATPPGSFPKSGVEEWLMFMDEVGIAPPGSWDEFIAEWSTKKPDADALKYFGRWPDGAAEQTLVRI